MILWGRASSVNVQKVLWALDEVRQPYDHKIVGGKYGGLDDPAFAAMAPLRRVPVLQDDDVTIWESHAILRYLDQSRISPIADMWMEFGSTTLQPPFIGLFWQRVRMTPEQQDAQVLAGHLKDLDTGLAALNAGLSDGRPFVAGDDYSMADVAIGSLFYRITDLYPDILSNHSHVAKWHKSIATRAGFRQWIATSYDELKLL
jgi:glutathione S-transferase